MFRNLKLEGPWQGGPMSNWSNLKRSNRFQNVIFPTSHWRANTRQELKPKMTILQSLVYHCWAYWSGFWYFWYQNFKRIGIQNNLLNRSKSVLSPNLEILRTDPSLFCLSSPNCNGSDNAKQLKALPSCSGQNITMPCSLFQLSPNHQSGRFVSVQM